MATKRRVYAGIKYAWKEGVYVVNETDPQKAGEHLDKLHDLYGRLTPAIVLEEAENKSSPLHGCFEWDDSRAANAYRKRQARQIISAIVIVPKRKSDPHTRAFYKVEDVKGYTTRERVLETESMRQEVLHKMMIRLKQARNIYEEFAELSGVVSEIDKL